MLREKGTRTLTSNKNNIKMIPKSKRSQIAQTINWTVATIIIIVILLVSFFVVRAGDTGNFILPDKQKDFIATKSIVNFVKINEDLIKNSAVGNDYSEFDKKFKPFLENLYTDICEDYCYYDGEWNLHLRFLGVTHPFGHGLEMGPFSDPSKYYEMYFIFQIDDKILKLNFWKERGWINL